MTQPELWVCRHGETAWSRARRHTSHTDLPLTERGAALARSLGVSLGGTRFDLVLTSPLRRARDTAALAGFPDAEVEPDAVEWDYGAYEGRTTAEIRADVPGWDVWTGGLPGGETPEQVADRVDRVIARVRRTGGTRALLFAHAHVLRVLGARWVGDPPRAGAHLVLDTAALGVLGWERETPALVRWNVPAVPPGNGAGAAAASP